ncbi:MAG: ATP-binding protein [Planctomycetota bacterium]
MNPQAQAPGSERRRGMLAFGLGSRLGWCFALLGVLSLGLGVLVSIQVQDMRTSVARAVEEQREADTWRALVLELRAFGEHFARVRGPAATETERELARASITNARVLVATLASGAPGADPSRGKHEDAEQAIFRALDDDLLALAQALASSEGSTDFEPHVQRVRARAQELAHEMQREARRALEELRARSETLRTEVVGTMVGFSLILALAFWGVRVWIVRPVQALRAGVLRVARGELQHRVGVAQGGEVGDLAREFDGMASELQSMRAELEQRVEARTQEFVRAARLAGLGTMAAGIAHEINNPLASIVSCAEGLERRLDQHGAGGVSPERLREYLHIIGKEANRAHGITSMLLDFARSEPGARVPFTLPVLLRELEVLLEHRLRSLGVSLVVGCDPGVPALLGDPRAYKQVLLNLIDNAIDASPPRGTVRVRCRSIGSMVALEVADSGVGIAPEDRERMFDPFFTTKPPGKGTGLGLAIVHRIVQADGGRIEVDTSEHGTTMRVLVKAPDARAAARQPEHA